MKYQLLIYTDTPYNNVIIENTDDKNVFDRYEAAVLAGKHATLNKVQGDGSYKTIKLKYNSRVENKENKPV